MFLSDFFISSALKYPENNCILYTNSSGNEYLRYVEVYKHALRFRKSLKHEIPRKCCLILNLNLSKTTPIIILSTWMHDCSFYYSTPGESGAIEMKKLACKLKTCWLLANEQFSNEGGCWEEMKKIRLLGEEIRLYKSDCPIVHSSLAYTIQTSGSMGSPKFVQVPHTSILPNILDLRELFRINTSDVILLSSPLTFDPSIVEIFLAFSSGACLNILSKEVKNNKHNFHNAIKTNKITLIQTTPSLFKKYLMEIPSNTSLKTLILGGENFPPWKELKNSNLVKNKKTKIFNIYGITEVSCWASCKQVWPTLDNDSLDRIDVGSPLSDTIFRLKNVQDNIGELYIGAFNRICLINNEDKEKLKIPAFRSTGDLFELKDRKYYFISRKEESAFKRFGIKINSRILENTANDYPCESSAVWVKINSDIILGLFVVLDEKFQEFKDWLKNCNLPRGHWPDAICQLDEIPLTKHGKVDRSKLKEILKNRYLTNKNETIDKQFMRLWKHYTGSQLVSDESKFVESGGDSIKAIQFSSTIGSDDLIGHLVGGSTYSECFKSLSQKTSISLVPTPKRRLEDTEENKNVKNLKMDLILILRGIINPSISSLYTSHVDDLNLNIAWKQNLQKCVDSSPLGIIFNSTGEKLVICASHSGMVAVIDATSGQTISQVRLPDRVESSACLGSDQNSYFIGCYDGCVYHIDLRNGKIKNHFKTDDMVKSTCVSHSRSIYFGSYDKYFYSISEDCQLKWKKSLESSVLAGALIHKESIYVCGTSGGVWSLSFTGNVNWHYQSGSVFSNPVIDKQLIIAQVSGQIIYLDLDKGILIHYIEINDFIYSSPIISDSKIYLMANNALNIISDGKIVSSLNLNEQVISSPCFINDQNLIAVSTSGKIFLISLTDNKFKIVYNLDEEVFSSPVVFPDKSIVVGCRDNNVYCFKHN